MLSQPNVSGEWPTELQRSVLEHTRQYRSAAFAACGISISVRSRLVLRRPEPARTVHVDLDVNEEEQRKVESLALDTLATLSATLIYDERALGGRLGCTGGYEEHASSASGSESEQSPAELLDLDHGVQKWHAAGISIHARNNEGFFNNRSKHSRSLQNTYEAYYGCERDMRIWRDERRTALTAEAAIVIDRGLPLDIYEARSLAAPCGGLGGLWDERLEWQTLGIGICLRLHGMLVPHRLKKHEETAVEMISATAAAIFCDGFPQSMGGVSKVRVLSNDLAEDEKAGKEWRALGIAICERLMAHAKAKVTAASGSPTDQQGAPVTLSIQVPPLPNVSVPCSMPTEIGDVRTVYKTAGQHFTERLYNAAASLGSIGRYMDETQRPCYVWVSGGPFTDDQRKLCTETVYEVKEPESYVAVATLLVEKAPEKVRMEMLTYLQKEIVGREVVDAWHAMLLNGDPQRGRLKEHQAFTEALRRAREVLISVLRERENGPATVERVLRNAEVGLTTARKALARHVVAMTPARAADEIRWQSLLLEELPLVNVFG